MKLIIRRSKWLRGEASPNSFLLRDSDDKQCCVGLLCSALGVPDSLLRGEQGSQVLKLDASTQLPEWLRISAGKGVTWDELPDLFKAYRVNDQVDLPAEERERLVTEIFARHDVEVVFED